MLFEIGTLAAGTLANVKVEQTLSNRNCEGVLVSFADPTDVLKISMSVELQSKEDGNGILMPEVPICPFVELADILLGGGFGATYVEKAEADGTDKSIQRSAYLVRPFGTAVLSGDDKLIIRLKTTGTLTGEVRAMSLDTGPCAERLLKVSEKQRTDAQFKDVERILAYNQATDAEDDPVATETLGACKVLLRGPNGDQQFDVRDAWDLTRAVGRIESEGTRRTVVIYEDEQVKAPGASVTVTLSGTNAGNYVVYGLERFTPPQRSANAQATLINTLKARTDNLRDTQPEKFAGLAVQNRLIALKAA